MLEEIERQNKIDQEEQKANDMMTHEERNEIARKEKIMARFKRQILNPNFSDNIYMELNIKNLRYFYEKSLKEFKDIQEFFSITPENEQEVLYYSTDLHDQTGSGHKKFYVKKSDQRIEFEERCYMTKLTFREVQYFMELQKKRISDI